MLQFFRELSNFLVNYLIPYQNRSDHSAATAQWKSVGLVIERLLVPGLIFELPIRVVSLAGLFGSGSGLKLTKISGLIGAWDVLFVYSAQKI